MNESLSTRAYFDTHEQLTTWKDELEFLGYILCEVINPDGFSERGFQFHQAADLPTIVDMLQKASRQPDGYLTTYMNNDELKVFRKLLKTVRGIRNMVAHHQVPDEKHLKLNDLRLAKERLCSRIESLITQTASESGISQLDWIPYHSTPDCCPETKSVYLNNGPLLSLRHRLLETHSHHQSHFHSRREFHTAEHNRQKNLEELEISLKWKEERRERHVAKLYHDQTTKLQKLQERYDQLYRCRCTQLEEVKSKMQEERKMFEHQQERIFKEGIVHPDLDEKLSPMLIFLGVSSPLWFIGFFLCASALRDWGFISES